MQRLAERQRCGVPQRERDARRWCSDCVEWGAAGQRECCCELRRAERELCWCEQCCEQRRDERDCCGAGRRWGERCERQGASGRDCLRRQRVAE